MILTTFLDFAFDSIALFVSSDVFAIFGIGVLSFGVVVLIPKLIYSIIELR